MHWLLKTVREMNYKGMAIYSIIMGPILLLATIYIDKKTDLVLTFLILIIVSSINSSVERWTRASEKREAKK